jgi:tetratricopeptide (TPR) repeat protein
VNGQPAQSVTGVQVRAPGATRGELQTLDTGSAIAPGSELTIPRGTRIDLTSSNGNKITLHPGARFVVGIVTVRGEFHQPLGGRIDFQVRRALDFFNIQYDRITASVKGTEYSVEIDPAKSLKLTVIEGVVEVERQVQIKFAEADSDSSESGRTTGPQRSGSSMRIAEDLKTGQSKIYRLDVEEYLAEFNSFGEAEAYFKKALAEAEASGDTRRILPAVRNLMQLYWRIGKPTAALDLQGTCVALAQGRSDLEGEAACLGTAGIAYGLLGEYRKAIEYHEKSLAIQERLYAGRDHPNTAASLNNLGIAYRPLGEIRKAIEYYEKSLAMEEHLYAGRDHPDIAASLNNLGNAYYSRREYRKAIEHHDKALAMEERLYAGRDHPAIAQSFNNLGVAYEALSEHRKAIEYHEKSLAMRERVFAGRDHPSIARSLNNLGAVYESLRDYLKAVDYYERSLAMRERVFGGRDHPDIVLSLRNLADAHEGSGQKAEAARYRERANAMRRRLDAR